MGRTLTSNQDLKAHLRSEECDMPVMCESKPEKDLDRGRGVCTFGKKLALGRAFPVEGRLLRESASITPMGGDADGPEVLPRSNDLEAVNEGEAVDGRGGTLATAGPLCIMMAGTDAGGSKPNLIGTGPTA
jgi:hypothetical protein